MESTHPDLAIIDISLKTGHGLDLVREVRTRYPEIKILILSAYEESLYAERSLRAGAMGYLNKQHSCQQILKVVRTVLQGERYVSAEITQRLIGQAIGATQDSTGEPEDKLSQRELEVFQMIGEGLTTGEINKRLLLSRHTIDSHREKIKTKLQLKNAGELHREATRWILDHA